MEEVRHIIMTTMETMEAVRPRVNTRAVQRRVNRMRSKLATVLSSEAVKGQSQEFSNTRVTLILPRANGVGWSLMIRWARMMDPWTESDISTANLSSAFSHLSPKYPNPPSRPRMCTRTVSSIPTKTYR
uniref:Uncharacterized protein n=1 Tax=Cacopsylla melanoneura TaxID=428564 RepID=A0A8D8VSU8_9HEMI